MRSLYKIIHTTCHTQWGELEKRIFNESAWMNEKGHTVIIIAPKDTPLLEKSKEAGIKTYSVDFKILGRIMDYKKLKNIFLNEKPDIVNTHGNADSKIALRAAYKAEINCRILSRHITSNIRNSWFNKRLHKKFSNYIFTTANHTTEQVKKAFKLNEMNVFTIPNGITPPESLKSTQKARKSLTSELSLDEEARFIGVVGKISKSKEIDTIIRAFKKIKQSLPNHHLVIIGDSTDEYENEVKELVKSFDLDDTVHFTGFKENIWPYYRAFDCNILASLDKDVPQPIIEAMYCSCPVIGSNSGGIPDIISHEETGLLFEANDSTGLSEIILTTINSKDITKVRAENAKAMIEKDYIINEMGRNVLRIYKLHQIRTRNEYRAL
jgi:glycosyltransferase involved in cell wall biosynthesis